MSMKDVPAKENIQFSRGIITGGSIGGIIGLNFDANSDSSSNQTKDDTAQITKMQLREERLDISKEKIQVGEVNIYKEVLTEDRNITVPVTREELVIEKKVPNFDSKNKSEVHTEIIRIPIAEERIDISKHRIELEDVSVYTQQSEDIKHVTETLKKEVLHIDSIGNAKVINKTISKK